jgi:hypothetical protein
MAEGSQVSVYATNYNVLRIMSGMVDLRTRHNMLQTTMLLHISTASSRKDSQYLISLDVGLTRLVI